MVKHLWFVKIHENCKTFPLKHFIVYGSYIMLAQKQSWSDIVITASCFQKASSLFLYMCPPLLTQIFEVPATRLQATKASHKWYINCRIMARKFTSSTYGHECTTLCASKKLLASYTYLQYSANKLINNYNYKNKLFYISMQ